MALLSLKRHHPGRIGTETHSRQKNKAPVAPITKTKLKAVVPTAASTPISTTSKAASTKTKSDTKDGAIHASHEVDQSTNPKRRLRNKTPARE